MTDVVIVEGESHGEEEPGEIVEAVEAIGEAVETETDAQVEIARIEAERDVTIAAINAEVEEARIEGVSEAVAEQTSENEELERCRLNIAELEMKVATLETVLQLIQQSSTPPELPQMENPSEEESGEVTPESHEEVAKELPPKPVRRSRWI